MEEGELHVVEEEWSQSREAGSERERVGGTQVHDREEEGELVVEVLQLKEPQPQSVYRNTCREEKKELMYRRSTKGIDPHTHWYKLPVPGLYIPPWQNPLLMLIPITPAITPRE